MSKRKRLYNLEKVLRYKTKKVYVVMPDFEGKKRVSVSGGERMTLDEFQKIDTSDDEVIEVNFV